MAWKRILGHDAVIQQLQSAFQRGRLGHAYLFLGPHGVGKRLFAKELTKALFCAHPPEPLAACDRCSECKLVEADSHPDFTKAVKPEEKHEMPVETMHDFIATLGLKPSRSRRKVGFIEDAEEFNEESANVFLKTLEEPPPGSLLILRANVLESQLPTILSRCQPVRFLPLSPADVRTVLAEQGIADAARQDRLVRLSHGSVGRAIALNDPALWEFRGGLLEALAAPRLNHAALAERWTKFVEEAGKDSAAQRSRASLALQLFIDLLETALRITLNTASPETDGAARLQPFATRLGTENLLKVLEASLDADRHVEQRVNLPLALELMADRLVVAV